MAQVRISVCIFFFGGVKGGGGLCMCGNDDGLVHFLHVVAKTPPALPK